MSQHIIVISTFRNCTWLHCYWCFNFLFL